MERIGKFVIREQDGDIRVYRIIGYDFEKQKCIMKGLSASIGGWHELFNSNDFTTLNDKDKLCTSEEAIELVKKYLEWLLTARDVLSAVSRGACKNWPVVNKRPNYQTELAHLYNALDNTLCTLYYVEGKTEYQACKDYTKSLHNLKKRFYFYYGDAGKQFVDYIQAVNTGTPKALKERAMSLHFAQQRYRKLLSALEDYVARVPEIKYM